MKKIFKNISAIVFLGLCVMSFEILAQDTDDIWMKTSPSVNPKDLPLGDGKYSTTPTKGFVYPCDVKAYDVPVGASEAGKWIHGNTWSYVEKIEMGGYVHGSVLWPDAVFNISTTSDSRVFSGNGLPVGEVTGIFPIQKTDPAYQYDHNPNGIKKYDLFISVPLYPKIADTPSCTSKATTGISLNGVPFYSFIDSQGRDEQAYEMQDGCQGMPENNGHYHHHALSTCIPHIHENNALIGYALDGFGIYSPYDADGNEITSKDLDICHGTTSPIMWDGKMVNMYHYVVTRDFPYTMTCFRGTPTILPMPSPPIVFYSPKTLIAFAMWWITNGSAASRIIFLVILGITIWFFVRRKRSKV